MLLIAYFVIAAVVVYGLIELKAWLDRNEQ
jgi:hypothetical protein